MEKQEFAKAFEKAAQRCLVFTKTLVYDQLPELLRFNFRSGIIQNLENGKVKFIGGRVFDKSRLIGLDGKEAGQFLWVDGQIPVWINLNVAGYDERHTYIAISFNPRRLTKDHNRLMYREGGNPPFHILGPAGAEEKKKIFLKKQ